MTILPALLKAYEDEGFIVSTGLNANHFFDCSAGQLTWLIDSEQGIVFSSAGIAFDEVMCLEHVVQSMSRRPRSVLVIGNMFGWSAIALAMICKGAKLVAIDNLEAPGAAEGCALTHRIAERLGLDVTVVKATSPGDVGHVHAAHFDAPVDLVFIDGLHTDDQIVSDFLACQAVAGPETIFFFHDVVAFLMQRGFNNVAAQHTGDARLLSRTSTGMGVAFPTAIGPETRALIDAYSGTGQEVEAMYFHARKHKGPAGSAYAPFIEESSRWSTITG
jgi:Methyltransferase domain